MEGAHTVIAFSRECTKSGEKKGKVAQADPHECNLLLRGKGFDLSPCALGKDAWSSEFLRSVYRVDPFSTRRKCSAC